MDPSHIRFSLRDLIRAKTPRRIWIVFFHSRGELTSSGAEIFLVYAALLVDDERHYAGLAVLRRPRYQREAGNHVTIDNIVVPAAGRVAALAGENLEVISVVRNRPNFAFLAVSFLMRVRDERPERADFAVELLRPV